MPTLVFPAPGFTSSTQLTTEFNGFDLSSVTGSTVTNLLRYSNNLTTGAWSSTGGTSVSRDPASIHTVSAQSPGLDYYLEYSTTSDIFVSTSTSTITQSATVKPNTTYTFSFYAKAGTSTDVINYRVYDNTNSAVLVAPTDYSTGLIVSTATKVYSSAASTSINLLFPFFNTYSTEFTGSNYIYETSASYVATGNFTLEGWFYFTGTSQNSIFTIGNEGTGRIVFFHDGATNQLSYNIFGSSSVNLTATTVASRVWTHIAIVRSGTTMTTYVNGLAGTPLTLSGSLGNSSGSYIMGSGSAVPQGAGIISNFRYVNGTALYTGSFNPQRFRLAAVTNTQLLLFQSAASTKDNSSNNYTMQQGGTIVSTIDGNLSLYVGMQVTGSNIAANSVITSIANSIIGLSVPTTAVVNNTVTFTDSRWKRISSTFTTNGTCTSVAVQPFYVTADIAGNILLTKTQLEIGSTASNTQITLDVSYAATAATQQITYSTIKYSTVSKVVSRAKLTEDRTTRVIGQLRKPIEIVRLVPLSKTSTVNLGTAAGTIFYRRPASTTQVFFAPISYQLRKPIEIVKSVQFPVAGRINFKWPARSNQVFFTRTATATLSKPIEIVRLVPLSKTSTVNLGTAVGTIFFKRISIRNQLFFTPNTFGRVNSRARLKEIIVNRNVTKLSLFPVGINTGDFELAVTGQTATTTNNLLNFYLDYSVTSDTLVSTPVANATTTLYFNTQTYVPFDVGSGIFVVATASNNDGTIYTTNNTVTVTSCTYNSVSFATPAWTIPDSGLKVKSGATVYNRSSVQPINSHTGLARDNLFYSEFIPSIRQDRYQNRFNNFTLNPTPTAVEPSTTVANLTKPIEIIKALTNNVLTSKLSLFPVGINTGDFELAVTGQTATTTNNLLNFYLDYSVTSDTLVSTPVANATTTLYFSTQRTIPFDVGSEMVIIATNNNNGIIYTTNNTVTVTSCTYNSVSFATPSWSVPAGSLLVKSGATVYNRSSVQPINSHTGLARDNFFYSEFIPSIRQDRYQNRFNTFTLNIGSSIFSVAPSSKLSLFPVGDNTGDFELAVTGQTATTTNNLLNFYLDYSVTSDTLVSTPVSNTTTTLYFNTQTYVPFDVGSNIFVVVTTATSSGTYIKTNNTVTVTSCTYNSVSFATPSWSVPAGSLLVKSGATVYNRSSVQPINSHTGLARDNLFYLEFIPSIRQDRYQNRFNNFTLNPTPTAVEPSTTVANLAKPIEVIKALTNNILTGKVNSRAVLKSDRIILTPNQLQKQIEKIKGLPVIVAEFDPYLINKLKVPSNKTQIFDTSVTGKVNSRAVLKSDRIILTPNQLQKQIEKINGLLSAVSEFKPGLVIPQTKELAGLPNTSSIFDLAQLQKQIEKIKGLPVIVAEFDPYLINKLKVPSNKTQIFDTPVTDKLRSAFVAQGLPNTSSVFDTAQLQKQIQAIKGLTITSTIVPYAINKFRIANINTQVFDTPVISKLRSEFIARGLPNTSSVFDPARLRSAFVLRSDRNTITSGKVNSNAVLKTPVQDSSIVNFGVMNKTTWNSDRTQVFYVTNSHKLSQFAPSSNTTGDFVVTITGQTATTTNNLLNFYLDYSVTSDTLVSTPVANATTTLYFSPTSVIPFDVGSTIKLISTRDNIIRYVTVTGCTTGSVSFAKSDWAVLESGYIIESGATVYSQYSALPTTSHTGLARDNFFWFNLSPYVRSSRNDTSAGVINSTLTINDVSVQGNLTKSIEQIKGLPNTTSVFDLARLRSVAVLTTDKNSIKDLILTGILKKQVYVPNSTVFDAPIANSFRSNFVLRGLPNTSSVFDPYLINKFRVANINTQVFDTPVTSKLRSAFVAQGLPNISSVFDPATLRSAFVLNNDKILLSNTFAGIQTFKVSYQTTQVFDTPISYNLPKAIELVKGLPNTTGVFDSAQLEKQIAVIRSDKNNISSGKVSSTSVLNNPTPFDILVFNTAQLQKQIQAIKGLPNISSVFDSAQLQKPIEIVRDDRNILFTISQNTFKISYKTTHVFDTPISYNLPKAIELVKGLPNTTGVFDPAKLRSAFDARGLPNISSVFDSAQLQKQIQTIKGLPNISSVFDPARLRSAFVLNNDKILLSNTFAGIQTFKVSYQTTQVFDTPITYNLPKAVEIVKDLVNNILTGKVSSTAVLNNPTPFDSLVFDPAQLQKQIEIVRDDRILLSSTFAGIQNPFKISYKTTHVFDTPISYNLPKAIELVKGLPNTTTVFDSAQLQKQIEQVRSDKNNIISGKVNSRAVLKNPSPFDILVFDTAQLQKPIEIIKDLTNNILTGKVNSRAALKNPAPNDSLVSNNFIDQFRYPADRLQVLYLGTDLYKLSQFAPSSNTTGDFVVRTTGRNPKSTNNLLNFYLDYSVTSDTLVSTSVANATTTLYFSPTSVIPFDVGSTIKLISTRENIIRYVTVTGCTTGSVSFATPDWAIIDSGYIIESGATVYSQYSALPTTSHTGLARDNFFWFNLSPYVRSSRNDTSAGVINSTFSIDSNRGDLAKPIEVIKDLVNNILTGRVTSAAVLRSDRLNLSTSLINKLKTPSSLTAVFDAPTSSKVKSINKLIGISTIITPTQLQKPIEAMRSDSVRLNAGAMKRSIIVRDSTVRPAAPNFPDLMTDWKSLIKGSTNTVKSTTYNASYIWLTTRPTNAIGNLFYATFIPSIRQDRYQTRFNTFTLNVESPILQAPASSSLKSAFVASGLPNISSVFDTAQLQKQIEIVKGTSDSFDIPKLRAISKLVEPYRFKTQTTLARDIIRTRGADEQQVFFLDANQGKVRATSVLTDVYSKSLVTPIEAYDPKILTLNVRATNSRENFFYSEFIPSIRQDRYQNSFNTFTLNVESPILQSPTPANLTKSIERVRSDSIRLASAELVNKLKLPAGRTQVFYSPTVENLRITSVLRGLLNGSTVFVPTHLQKPIEIIKDPTALDYRVFTTVGKTLLREIVREVPSVLDYLSVKKVKLNTNTVQLFYAPDNGLITKFKSGVLYGIGIADPTFRKTEPIQFWN